MQQQNISVLSWASPPRFPDALSGKQMLVLALLMGLITGRALALLLEFLDRRIRDPEDVTRELDLPMLGDLPARG